MVGAAIYGGSGFAMRRKFSAREFWEDVRRFNASAIGYVGELCRYLMEVPAKPEDRAHREGSRLHGRHVVSSTVTFPRLPLATTMSLRPS